MKGCCVLKRPYDVPKGPWTCPVCGETSSPMSSEEFRAGLMAIRAMFEPEEQATMTLEDLKQDLIDTAAGYLAQRDFDRVRNCVDMFSQICHAECTTRPFGLSRLSSGAALGEPLPLELYSSDALSAELRRRANVTYLEKHDVSVPPEPTPG